MGGARLAARDTVERADQDYELELHSRMRSEEVIEAERVASADDKHQHDARRTPAGRTAPARDDDPDDEPHRVDVTA